MIAKKYRLKEREVKKVLQKGKPFFSYSIVFNRIPNRLGYTRFAIVIGKKTIPNNVVRNTFRRLFYERSASYISRNMGDIVCVVKSKTKLHNTPECKAKFTSELHYLLDKKLGKNI